MKHFHLLLFLAAAVASAQPAPNPYLQVRTFIGTGSRGDGAAAADAWLDGPFGLAQDPGGNIYISESNAGVIRRVRPDGTIERFAGSGVAGDGSAGNPALQTSLQSPTVMLIHPDGSLFFADSQACRIRKVQTDGTIQDVVGTGRCTAGGRGGASSGDRDMPAMETDITGGVGGMVFDTQGRLVYTETDRHIIRRLDTDGIVRTIAGKAGVFGSLGDGGDASSATLYYPAGLATDGAGTIFIADGFNCKIRRIDDSGNIDTVAGSSACSGTASTFTGKSLDRVGPVAYDASTNALLIGLPRAYRVVRFDLATSQLAPFLGNGRLGAIESPQPLSLTLNEPTAILPTDSGILVAAASSYQVYAVANGTVTQFAGSWPQVDNYPPASAARLLTPQGLSATSGGALLVIDTAARRLLRRDPPDVLSASAGAAYPFGFNKPQTGPALQTTLNEPARVVQRSNGDIYLAESTRISAIDGQGVIRTIQDYLDHPAGLAFDAQDRLVFSEAGQHRVVRLDLAAKTLTVIAGTGKAGFSGDGGAATSALLNSPGDLAFDPNGNLLVADRLNHRVRRIDADGTIHTVVGSGLPFNYSDITGQQASNTGFGEISGMAVDGSGVIYVCDGDRVSMILADGTIRVLTGLIAEDDNGNRSYFDGPLNGATGLAVDSSGQVYISTGDGRVLVAAPR